ncbi:MAG: DNA polymerase III subunit gamma/tau [bacterium]|nr:DNA polymerase III subunit gamma/tau [bacterium]
MGYLALYRKYRPKTFFDVVGQDNIVRVLKNSVINNRVSHAYLFAGQRGTGKTTLAKILANVVNCEANSKGEACGKCATCLLGVNEDIVEIDAASNNGVEEIRDLREKANLVPANAKYKVYIIDEVHMLTTSAFNALLKTLEEPPSHVIFILATTELHKVPVTVLSRCQKFVFNKISVDNIVARLKYICGKEKIDVSDDVLKEIARLSDGGMRDSISLLDQLISFCDGKLTVEAVHEVTGTVSLEEMYKLLKFIGEKSTVDVLNIVDKMNKEGKNILKFVEEFMIFIKDILLYKSGVVFEEDSTVKMLSDLASIYNFEKANVCFGAMNKLLAELKISSYPFVLLEVYLVSLTIDTPVENSGTIIPVSVNKPVENLLEVPNKKELNNIQNQKREVKLTDYLFPKRDLRINNTFCSAAKNKLVDAKNKWNQLDDFLIVDKYKIVAGLLRDTSVLVAGDNNLILLAKSLAVRDRVNTLEKQVSLLLKELFNKTINIVCLNEKEWEIERRKYIDNLNNNYQYVLIEEEEELISEDIEDSNLKSLIEVFGDDIIEIR